MWNTRRHRLRWQCRPTPQTTFTSMPPTDEEEEEKAKGFAGGWGKEIMARLGLIAHSYPLRF